MLHGKESHATQVTMTANSLSYYSAEQTLCCLKPVLSYLLRVQIQYNVTVGCVADS